MPSEQTGPMSEQAVDYGEPWRVGPYYKTDIYCGSGNGSFSAGACLGVQRDNERATRICLCVNALRGIPDAELERLDVKGLLEFLKIKAGGSVDVNRALAIARKGD